MSIRCGHSVLVRRFLTFCVKKSMISIDMREDENITQTLRLIGLQDKEITVYLSLLRLGQAPAQTIARYANIKRSTAYVVLDQLIEKGLVSKGALGNKTVYIAHPPERLKRVLQVREENLQHQKDELSRVMPNLRTLFSLAEDRPVIRLFEGKEGLINLQQEFIAVSKDEVVGMSPKDSVRIFLEDELVNEITKVRTDAGVYSRFLYTCEKEKLLTPEMDRKWLRESRWIPPEKLPLKNSFAVHGPLFSIVTFEKKIIGVLIEHQDIADSFRAVFEAAWSKAIKYNSPS